MAERKPERAAPERPTVARLVAKAATETVNVAVAGVASLGAIALQSWPVLGLGVAAYGALVAWDIFNPEYAKKAFGQKPKQLPDARRLLDPGAREAVANLARAKSELDRVVSETPAAVKANLGLALAAVDELLERSSGLLARVEELSRYLGTVKADELRAEVERLRRKRDAASDAAAREEYGQALAAREEQLRANRDIEGAHDRALATLSRIVATIEGLPAKIVRMRAMDAQAMDALTGNVSQELDQINGEVKAVEETLQSLAEVPRG